VAWVSLKKSLSELDILEEQVEACLELEKAMVATLRGHTLDINVAAAEDVRGLLSSMNERLQLCEGPRAFAEMRVEFERGWEEYYEKSSSAFRQLQSELAETVRALRETLSGMEGDTADRPEEIISRNATLLRQLCAESDLHVIRERITECAGALTHCVEDLRRERTMITAQLRDEIRTLQKHVKRVERAAVLDYVTGVSNRREMERLLSQAIQTHKRFSLVYVWLRNFKHIERDLPRPMSDRVISMASQEILRLLPSETALGRWSDDEFCALVGTEKPAALKLTRDLTTHLNTHFMVHGDNTARAITLKAHVGVVESHEDESPDKFFYRSDRLIKAIQGTA
jgi:diguanylate cyclase (GGDEF)-like protein